MLQPSEIERVLVVMAHPDDVDFAAAGTVAALTDVGVEAHYCLVTNGDAGGSDRSISRAEMAAIRQREQTNAAAKVGVSNLVFLGHGDGRVEASLQLRADISRVIREVRPTVVICQSPERNLDRIYASHPDHLAAAEATFAAVYPDARNPFAFPELLDAGLEPWAASEIWVAGSPMSSALSPIDITAQVERKIEALLCHESQHQDPQRTATVVRDWAAGTAKQFNMADGSAAEAFRVVNTR
jgi:LmbE family N-acetylglucosaminyl deacetylase